MITRFKQNNWISISDSASISPSLSFFFRFHLVVSLVKVACDFSVFFFILSSLYGIEVLVLFKKNNIGYIFKYGVTVHALFIIYYQGGLFCKFCSWKKSYFQVYYIGTYIIPKKIIKNFLTIQIKVHIKIHNHNKYILWLFKLDLRSKRISKPHTTLLLHFIYFFLKCSKIEFFVYTKRLIWEVYHIS